MINFWLAYFAILVPLLMVVFVASELRAHRRGSETWGWVERLVVFMRKHNILQNVKW